MATVCALAISSWAWHLSLVGPQSTTRLIGSRLPQSTMVETLIHLRRWPPRRHWKWALAVVVSKPVASMAAALGAGLRRKEAWPMVRIIASAMASTWLRTQNLARVL